MDLNLAREEHYQSVIDPWNLLVRYILPSLGVTMKGYRQWEYGTVYLTQLGLDLP